MKKKIKVRSKLKRNESNDVAEVESSKEASGRSVDAEGAAPGDATCLENSNTNEEVSDTLEHGKETAGHTNPEHGKDRGVSSTVTEQKPMPSEFLDIVSTIELPPMPIEKPKVVAPVEKESLLVAPLGV